MSPVAVHEYHHYNPGLPGGLSNTPPAGNPSGGPWLMAYEDDFNTGVGGKPDPAKWRDFLPEGDIYRCNDNSSEYEWYSHNRAGLSVHDGMCTMTARYESPYDSGSAGYDPACPNPTVAGHAATHTSGMINSQPSLNFRHGYVEARWRFQLTANVWPAFWGFSSDSAWDDEWDSMECFGAATQFNSTYIYNKSGNQGYMWYSGTLDQWHTSGFRFSPGALDCYFDGTFGHSYSNWDNPVTPWCVLFNLAVQGPIGAAGASTTLDVDYLRFWVVDGVPGQPVIDSVSPASGIPSAGYVDVTFHAGSGPAATGYRVTAIPVDPAADGITASHIGAISGSAGTVRVSGLANGKHYAFTAGASNGTGWGIESLPVPALGS